MSFIGIEDDNAIIKLFRDGELVSIDRLKRRRTWTNMEVSQANSEGQLIGALGMATLFGSCDLCGLEAHVHFSIGDSDRDLAHFELEDTHLNCSREIKIKEISE
jgi:hypothetical protein